MVRRKCSGERQAAGCVVFVARQLDQDPKECTSLEVVPVWGDAGELG